MGFFSGSKNKEKIVAIFDIGSGGVGGALVKIIPQKEGEKAQPPTIIAQTHTDITFQESLDFDTFFKDMQKALLQTSTDLFNMKKGAPSEIVCNLASPWYVGETRHIHMDKPAPFLITKTVIEDLVTAEQKALIQTYKFKYEEVNDAPYLMESKIFHSRLNGYLVDDIVGKRA